MITLFHDYTSPASAVAVARADRLRAQGVQIELAGFEAIGVDMHVPVTLDVLAELDLLTDAATAEGVTLNRPAMLPPTGLAHVIAAGLDAAHEQDAWRAACYTAFWTHGADLSDPEVLADLAASVGADGSYVAELLADRGALAAFRRATTERRRDGIGAVPIILAQRTLVPGLLEDDDLRALAAL